VKEFGDEKGRKKKNLAAGTVFKGDQAKQILYISKALAI